MSPRKEVIPSSLIDASKRFKFIIHGYIENSIALWYEILTTEFLKKGDFIVIQVDWEKIARLNYASSANNTKIVGMFIEFIFSYYTSCNYTVILNLFPA